MLAAWRAVCLAALSAALAAPLATGSDAGAGDTVRDFGLVCNVFRNVLQARGVAKAQKARADEVALAIEHAWLGEAREDLEEDVVVTEAAAAQTKKAEAKKLKEQAWELADKIDKLSYSAILGDKGDNQPDKAENESNVLFRKIAGSGDRANTGFADAQSGAALSNDMMWLCNVAEATAPVMRSRLKRRRQRLPMHGRRKGCSVPEVRRILETTEKNERQLRCRGHREKLDSRKKDLPQRRGKRYTHNRPNAKATERRARPQHRRHTRHGSHQDRR
ncbi:hypothetical protein ERJ75_000577900 [Trypanosoma vivax]|nr:hypothetical protein ERJ75_000577900 [Trypanosoma vivax]